MSKTYVLNSTVSKGGMSDHWTDGRWNGYYLNNGGEARCCGRNVGMGSFFATYYMFDTATLASLQTKTITSIKLTIIVTGGTGIPAGASDMFAIRAKSDSTTGSNSSGTAWYGEASILAYVNRSSGSSSTLEITLPNSVPSYGYVLGPNNYQGEFLQLSSTATLTVVTNENDYSYSLIYDANGGSGAPATQIGSNTAVSPSYTFTISSAVPTRTGYQFNNWNTQANGSGTSYTPGANIVVTSSTTLYAQWTALASVLSSVSNANITEQTTVNWTNYGSYTNKLRFIFGSADSGEISVSGTSYQYTLPPSWYDQVPNATSGIATVYLYTYVSGTLVGTSSKTFIATVKSSVVPSINNPTATAVNQKLGLYLQKYSSVTIAVTGGVAGSGANIQSYSITGIGLNYSVNTTDSSASATSSVFATAGTFTYTVAITDSRGRTASKTVSITVTAYSEPAISSVTGVRCDSNGTVNPTTGDSIKVAAVFTYSAAGSNTLTSTLLYKKHTENNYTTARAGISSDTSYVIATNVAEISSSYDVKLEISDSLNNSATYTIIVPPVVGIAFGLKNDRARFGGPVERAGLQVDWNAQFNGVVDVVPRRCEGVLNARGWYRVLEYSGTQYTVLGTGGAIIHVDITRSYFNQPNETHSIDLNLVYNKIVFNAESSVSWGLLIDKIRYVVNGDKGYIDIHYDGVNENIVCVNFAVSVQQYVQEDIVSVDFQSVSDTSSDETILAMHDFVAIGNNFTLPIYQNGTLIHS